MDWMEILNQIFQLCVVPLLGVLTSALIVFIEKKIAEGKKKADNELTAKYLDLLNTTIVDCIKATNQTYVEELKDKNAFDKEAQREALEKTTTAVKEVIAGDAELYLSNFIGDLNKYIAQKIEANISNAKKN